MSIGSDSILKTWQTNHAYFRKWYDFFYKIETYLGEEDQKKLEAHFPSALRHVLLQRGEERTRLRKEILQLFDLSSEVDYDISSTTVKTVVNNSKKLKQAAIISGAMYCYKEIVKIISKKELLAIKSFIGENTYHTIIKRQLVLRKAIPALPTETFDGLSLQEKINQAGAQIVGFALHDMPMEIRKRLILKEHAQFTAPQKFSEDIALSCKNLTKQAILLSCSPS